MTDFIQDIRYGARQLWNNPGFTLAAVLCIALGIGANSATFSFANSLLFRMPDVEEPERLVRLFVSWASGLKFGSFSYPDFVDFREKNDVFSGMIAETVRPLHLSDGERNEKVAGAIVSGNYFAELGVEIPLGRDFAPEEGEIPGSHPVAILSHGMWQRRFAADLNVVGRSVSINGHPFSVIGVAPQGFYGTNTAIAYDLWVPITMQEQLIPGGNLLDQRDYHWINFVTARLKPGVTVEQARDSTNALMANLIQEYPDNIGKSIDVYPESKASLHPMVRQGFVSFMALVFVVVGLVLLLACANVAGLLLARLAARHKEVGIRLALGASRRRLIRQLLSEALLLSIIAGGVGLILAVLLIRLVQSFQPPTDMPLHLDVSIDPIVLGFTFLAAVLTGVLFGVAPALQAIKQDLVSSLKEGMVSQVGGASRMRKALVVGQVALSLVLLIGAGLVIRSLQNARNLDPGFNPDNQLVAELDLDLQGYDELAGRQFRQSLRENVRSLPGVEAVGFAIGVPLNFHSMQRGAIPEGFEVPEESNNPSIDYNLVDHGYFQAMGIPILRGRGFAETDDEDAPPVLVVNQTFAERFWPGEDPIGKRVETAGEDHEVVGLVGNGKYFSLGEDPKPYMYLPLSQHYQGTTVVHVRTAGDPAALLPTVRAEIRNLDPTLPVSDLETMHAALGFALLPARMAAGVVSAFAFLALILAAVGLYGVIAYSVSQGMRDIGIRMALGARPADVLRLVLRQGLGLAAFGVAIGLVAGLGLARFMAGLLYDVSEFDPVAYGMAATMLSGVALMASFLPAHRATAVDPVVALREE